MNMYRIGPYSARAEPGCHCGGFLVIRKAAALDKSRAYLVHCAVEAERQWPAKSWAGWDLKSSTICLAVSGSGPRRAMPSKNRGALPPPGSNRESTLPMRRNFVGRGGLWVLSQGVLLLAVIVCGLVWRHQWCSLVGCLGGACLLSVATVCGVAGTLALGRNLTPFPQPSSSTRLVQRGLYGLIRHPLYTAVVCVRSAGP